MAIVEYYSLNTSRKEVEITNMVNWSVIEWVVFIICCLWSLMTNISVRQHYKKSETPTLSANAFAMIQILSVIFNIVFLFSPFHLIWLFLMSYIIGFFTLKIRIVGRIAWLYGYLIAYTIPSNW
jgi:hypothetical protein